MGGQFVFFYGVSVLLAFRYPTHAMIVIAVYLCFVIRNFMRSTHR